MFYYAEYDTDKYIRETFFSDFSYNGIMIEVGSGPPEYYSMSKHFRDNGWRCICIDPNPKFVKQHKDLGNEIYEFACSYENTDSTFKIVNSSWGSNCEENNCLAYSAIDIKYEMVANFPIIEIPIKVRTLNSLLVELDINKIDFLSVDTEGWEIEVMMGFDTDKYQPKVVLLKNLLYDESYVKYMIEKGYKLNQMLDYNYIFEKNKK
jgi:FkbM family methyltransferase